MAKQSDFHTLPARLICSNCRCGFGKNQLLPGYDIDLKIWCHDCRIGKNYVRDKCSCRQKGCYCKVGFPYELLCPSCRDDRYPGDVFAFCVCPPDEEIFDRWESDE